jgi:hypothetical protein
MITIPLQGGVANSHQILFVQLGARLFEFRINWRGYINSWEVDLYVEGALIAAGVSLKPDAEITAPYSHIPERIFFTGLEPTIDNLGSDNSMVYYG